MLCVTVVEAAAKQPLEGSVIVTEYGPGVVTVFVVPVPPQLQLYVTPGVTDDAVSVTLVTAQVNTAGAAIVTTGIAPLCVTVADVEVVQPLAGSVTVTEYGPAAFTIFVFVVIPPPQSYITPGVEDDAVNVTLVILQVKTAGGAILTFGIVIF